MAITRYWFSFGYRLVAGAISGATLAIQFDSLGLSAWRVLETWIVLIATLYFFSSAVVSWFRRKQPMPQLSICPLLQGFVLVAGIGLFILWRIYQEYDIIWVGASNPVTFLAMFAAPVLVFADWIFFTKKGSWSLSYPFYWLGLIISYCCAILLTVEPLANQSGWDYPYAFLNYPLLGIDNLLRCAVLLSVVVLVIGFALMLLDFTVSGKLGQHIVLPRIKTIIIEDTPATMAKAPSAAKPKASAAQPKPNSTPPKPATSEQTKKKPGVDVIKPVENLKDRKSAQKLHRSDKENTNKNNSGKSKTAIIADIRSQVTGGKKTSHPAHKKR